jgi:hypothetical protein
MMQMTPSTMRSFVSLAIRSTICLMFLGLTWQGAQAQVVIIMEDIPGLIVAPDSLPTPPQDSSQATGLVAIQPPIEVHTTPTGLDLVIPTGMTIYETEILDFSGRRLAQQPGHYQQATLRSSSPQQVAIIRWHTSQGLMVRKVRF